jgi:hypothetical protein
MEVHLDEVIVYYESIKRELKKRQLEHLKIKTRLIVEMFVIVMGEYVFLK